MTNFRSPYNYDRDLVSKETGLVCDPVDDMAQQQFREECDINTLIERFGIGYKMPDNLRLPQYGDFSHISNYHEAMTAIALARETFDGLPAAVRDRFVNDPGQFVEYALKPENLAEMRKLGLAPPEATPLATPPTATPPASPTAPQTPSTPQS